LPRTREGRRSRRSGPWELSTCPEGRFIVTSGCESFFRKLMKRRRQLDLMADINALEIVGERVGVNSSVLVL
ncbi:hypothetical protein PIB30_110245, partial [Stylosanthes scabra]|nr:hypothetical protein [Stylosanthes scabra]